MDVFDLREMTHGQMSNSFCNWIHMIHHCRHMRPGLSKLNDLLAKYSDVKPYMIAVPRSEEIAQLHTDLDVDSILLFDLIRLCDNLRPTAPCGLDRDQLHGVASPQYRQHT